MKAIMIMFDSLNRHYLPNYGCEQTIMPNFEKLGEKTVTFDNCYVGSLPCMPARREIHTGNYNFMHRGWSPMEPYDDSMPAILKNKGVHTHIITDHQHYWEDGGASYLTKYSTFEMVRGQEGDPWKADLRELDFPEEEVPMPSSKFFNDMKRQDNINRSYMEKEEDKCQANTFNLGLEFLETNKDVDNWFLTIETFDPHEPFFAGEEYKKLYPHEYKGKFFDWPPYYFVQENEDVVNHGKMEYFALLSMCDHYLGKILDFMDKNDMWKDTMLIVNTDHGYLLGEHGWWSKSVMPVYNEIANTPFFIWDPRTGIKNERRNSLVQTIDLAPTLLDFFNVDIPEMDGKPLKNVIANDESIRDYAFFGYHGGHANITDGEYLYMRSCATPENTPLFQYTLMPSNMRSQFGIEQLTNLELSEPFSFTKGIKLLKTKPGAMQMSNPFYFGSKLYDIKNDPKQQDTICNYEVESKLISEISKIMNKIDAPNEQYTRLGIPKDGIVSIEELKAEKENQENLIQIQIDVDVTWEQAARNEFYALLNSTPEPQREQILISFKDFVVDQSINHISENTILQFIKIAIPDDMVPMVTYFVRLAGRTF